MPSSYKLSYTQTDVDLMSTMRTPSAGYWIAVLLLGMGVTLGAYGWGTQIYFGMGMSGKNNPVGWALYITTFVFWVGIAHSGTLISAILFLFRVKWRAPVYRSAEAVTVFGLMVAGLFPLIHLGRPWVFYWMLPIPQMGDMFPNFRSPLVWDLFAVFTYLTVSSTFFILGMIPDVAIIRDKMQGWRKKIYGFLALGWRGTDVQWRHYTSAYVFLAALATPLVISVHSIVSWDFAMSVVPGWHATIFAPYFVAGAIHSGLAMVILLLLPMRKWFNLKQYITDHHIESLAKMLIFTALVVGFAYVIEIFIAWYSGHVYEREIFLWRATGPYWWGFWGLFIFNFTLPMLFWFKRYRTNTFTLVFITVGVSIGMWLERFVIIVTSLSHEYNPFSWGFHRLTHTEVFIIIGSFSLFFFLFLVFAKILPVVSNWEVKEQIEPPVKGGER
jgi:Ni/Fe-hydrogenase subunit HybB-like protein